MTYEKLAQISCFPQKALLSNFMYVLISQANNCLKVITL